MIRAACLLLLSLVAAGASAQQALVNCNPGVPCSSTTGPSNTGAGDPAWQAFGKINDALTNLNSVANVKDYGAFGDTTLKQTASLTSTAGSPLINFGTTISGAFQGATIVVGGCGKIIATAGVNNGNSYFVVRPTVNLAGAQITAAGSGYAIGDTITWTGSGGSFTTAPVSTVLAISSTVTSVGNLAGGSSYTAGTYTAVNLTGGAGSGAQATIVVIGTAVASVTITAAGSGYYIGDVLSALNTDIGGTGSGFSVSVNGIGTTGGVTQLNISTWGDIITFPTAGAFTQQSTSGAGTGVTATLVQGGLPLATTISAIAGNNVTLGANCSTTYAGFSTLIGWGHDDQPGIAAALASGSTKIVFPPGTYGIRANVTTNNNHRYEIDGQGSTIVSLAAGVTKMLNPGGGGFQFWPSQESSVHDLTLDGMGLSTPLSVRAAGWNFDHLFLRNAGGDTLVVDGATLSINNHFHHLTIRADPAILPNGCSGALIHVTANITDVQFDHIIANGCQQGVWDQGNGGDYYDSIHVYGVANDDMFRFDGPATHTTNLYADTPYGNFAGISLTGNNHSINGCYVFIASGASGNSWNPYGVRIRSGQEDVITGCMLNAFPGGSTRGVVDLVGRTNNYIVANNTHNSTTYQNFPGTMMLGFGTLGTAVTAAGATNYCQFGGGICQNGETKVRIISPYTGTLTNLYANSNADIGNTNTYTFTVMVNGAATGLGCVWTGTGAGSDSCSDLQNQVPVTAGQPIDIRVVTSAAATAVSVFGGVKFLTYH